jgi:hypothetical protein
VPRISPKFQSSDCWILLSVVWRYPIGPASLPDILGMADAINHAIPTLEELEGALNRLLASGHIDRREAGFVPTELALDAVARVTTSRKPILDIWDELDRLFACPCCRPVLKYVPRRVKVTPEEYRAAYRAYVARMAPRRRRATR